VVVVVVDIVVVGVNLLLRLLDPPNLDMATVLAEMQAMWAKMNALRQALARGVPGGVLVVPPERTLDFRDWCHMELDMFDGTGAPYLLRLRIDYLQWLSS
jgi:hypothetical protein